MKDRCAVEVVPKSACQDFEAVELGFWRLNVDEILPGTSSFRVQSSSSRETDH